MITVTVPPPPPPDFDALPAGVAEDLTSRLARLPLTRVKRSADLFALYAVERDHVHRLAHRFQVTDTERASIDYWWLRQLDQTFAGTRERLHAHARSALRRDIRRRRSRSKVLGQLWWNTVGPGGRCWFGNRYVTIRRYTFRLHWRP
ncbi:MAG: hypothetical protein ACLPVF_19205 [Acidimicrobiales bacterium]